MKFIRLTIKNYRGVVERTVEFAENGVTLVQGPNEIGKTSLAESVHMLFQYKASSNHQDVRGIKPVHRDAGTEIELEAESGGYHFIYAKKFHKEKSATLRILTPAPANYTDDEAHEQANRILAETLDKPLWDALIVRQGDMIQQPNLSGRAALMEALDSAAGGDGRDRHAETVFERVEAEYQKYFQKTGKDSTEITQAALALEQAEERKNTAGTLLNELEQKSERATRQKLRATDLRRQSAVKADELKKRRETLREIEALEREESAARLELKTAEADAQSLNQETRERERLLAAAAEAEKNATESAARAAELEPGVSAAASRHKEAEQAHTEAEEAERLAEAQLSLRRRDLEYSNNLLLLDMMRGNASRLRDARDRRMEAEAALAAIRLDEDAAENIQKAELTIARLRARLETAAPKVTLRGLGDGNIEIAGIATPFRPGETTEYSVTDALRIAVPGVVEMNITAGGGLEKESRTLASEERRLAELCQQAGVADANEAAAVLARRRRAAETVRESSRFETEALQGLSHAEHDERLEKLERTLAAHASSRPADCPMPSDAEAAGEALRRAEEFASEARTLLTKRSGERAAHDGERERVAGLHRQAVLSLEQANNSRRDAENALAAARSAMPDETLRERHAAAVEKSAAAARRIEDIEEKLRAKNPDQTRAIVAALEGAAASVERQLHEVERELAGLEAELNIRGEQGLFEELRAAEIEAEDRRERLLALRSRAEASRLLYTTMREERDNARRAYIAPLKDKIEELGRVIWNAGFSVEMNEEDVSIATRTLDGVTVPFASLSGGAREQLSLIFRAACAILVSKHAGMPLILDDALGYTDVDRLPLMGAVLARAAEQCQVIIFTCVPGRYETVGDAKVVQLS